MTTDEADRPNAAEASRTLFDAIAHGDSEHRAWLKLAIEDHFAGRKVARPSKVNQLPSDVRQLVIAARVVWDQETPNAEDLRALDIALEAFSDRVPYDDEPGKEAS